MPSKVFRGSEPTGSRRADTGAVLFALGFPTLLTYVYFTLLADAPTVVHNGSYGVLKAIQFGFPLAWFVLVQRNQLKPHLPTTAGIVPAVAFGLAVTVAMGCLYQFLLLPTGVMNPVVTQVAGKVEEFGANTLLRYSMLAVFYIAVFINQQVATRRPKAWNPPQPLPSKSRGLRGTVDVNRNC
ncbi:MAG: hypothetical protein N2C12_13220 [Planctomycetales bacterium]